MSIGLSIYYVLLLLIFVLGIVRFKKLAIPYKILCFYVGATLLLEILSYICARKYQNNMPVEHISAYSEFIFNALIFYHLIKSTQIKKIVKISTAIITLFFFINSLWLQTYLHTFPSNAIIVSEIVLVVFSLLVFKQMLQYPLQVTITSQSIFWYNTAILFYSTTVFLNFGLINYVVKHHLDNATFYNCRFILNMIFYILLGIAIFIEDKKITADNAG